MSSFPIFFFFFFLSLISLSNATNVWCNRTPYPDICSHSFNDRGFDPKNLFEFREMARKIAMERVQSTYNQIIWLGEKCRNNREKTAWVNCLHLYENTIFQLNKTFTNCTDFDVATWVSASLTNLETCRDGFFNLNVTDYAFLLMSSNVTKLIENCLAIISASNSLPNFFHIKDCFPKWLKSNDRKILQSPSPKPHLVVAQDGSGDYTTIQAALSASKFGDERVIIFIKKGIYFENIMIERNMRNLMLVGDGMRYTIISGDRSRQGGFDILTSATVAVEGDGFNARDITFRNTAGPHNQQAVALRSSADHSVFYRCGFEGYQDTLFVDINRQFYKECYIYGTVDFIFGNAIVVLQNCMINVRKPMPGQQCVITAQGREYWDEPTGISIHNSRIMAAADLIPVQNSVRTYLGRPWKKYSRTVYLKSFIDSLVDPAGWLEWNGDFALDTLYYGEYSNFGPGSSTNNRVKWKGFRVITSEKEASEFTVENFIDGRLWLPETGVPFTPGL